MTENGVNYYYYYSGSGGGGGDGGTWKDSADGGSDVDWVGKNPPTDTGGGAGAVCGAQSYAAGGGSGVGLKGKGSNGVRTTGWPSSTIGGSNGGPGGTTPSGESWQTTATGLGGLYGGAADDYFDPGYYQYFRIYITSRDGASDYTSIGEIELYATNGGPDLTSSVTPCVALSFYPGYPASKIVDNIRAITTDCWVSLNNALPQWVYFQLTEAVKPYALLMYPHPTTPSRGPASFIVQGSNDANTWTDIKTFNTSGWVAGTPKLFIL